MSHTVGAHGVRPSSGSRSRRAFEKNGFSLHDIVKDAGDINYDLMIRRED